MNFALKIIPCKTFSLCSSFSISLSFYPGVRRSQSHNVLFGSLCLTVSALWCGSGLVHILAGENIINSSRGLRDAMVPGLAAFTLALLVICIVAILCHEVVLSFIALSICLACAHQIAGLADSAFGQAATAVCYLMVCFVGAYFGSGRLLSYITQRKIQLPGTFNKDSVKPMQSHDANDVVTVGVIMNLLSASVLACPLLGVVPKLFSGHVPWLWTAGVFQLGVCVKSYRSMDTLAATFYGFTSILRFTEGYTALVVHFTNQVPYSPVPFPVVFSVLFFILALFNLQGGFVNTIYQLFFVTYCIAIASEPQSFFQRGTQGVQAAIFVVSAFVLFITLYNMASSNKIPTGAGFLKNLLARSNRFVLQTNSKELHAPYLGYSKYADAEVLGHGCSVLAAFSITASLSSGNPLAILILPWAVVSGGVLHLICGSVAFARGKTLESTTFILYGIMWTVWGLTRFGGLYGDVRGFHLAVGIISFMLFNVLVTAWALFLNKAWFIYTFTFQLILISFLLDAVGVLPYGYDIGVTIILGLVSFYMFLASIFNCTFKSPQMPFGDPFIKLSGFGGGKDSCPHLPARKSASVQQIAGESL